MIEDLERAYAEQEVRGMKLVLENLVEDFKCGAINIDQFASKVMQYFETSMWEGVSLQPPQFEKCEVTDPIEYAHMKMKQFNESEDDTERRIIHDCIQYAISRMDITEIAKSGIYDK